MDSLDSAASHDGCDVVLDLWRDHLLEETCKDKRTRRDESDKMRVVSHWMLVEVRPISFEVAALIASSSNGTGCRRDV
ncbi:MAG: hypothetical protein DMF56_02300 [Acidobacteria bacterium]|nr:MAG: hypothetical protein DMF56_02300 [Acidobacteriota bacterium]